MKLLNQLKKKIKTNKKVTVITLSIGSDRPEQADRGMLPLIQQF